MSGPAPIPYSGGPSGPRANFGRRLLAFLIDIVIVVVPFAVVVNVSAATGHDSDTAQFLAFAFLFAESLAYFALFEGGRRGQTLGKRALGIRVIHFETGHRIGYGRAVGRNLARIVSNFFCYLGYFWMLWDTERQTWHDKIATTIVVPLDAYPVDTGTP